jgi:hypothetical protein
MIGQVLPQSRHIRTSSLEHFDHTWYICYRQKQVFYSQKFMLTAASLLKGFIQAKFKFCA